MGGESYKKMEKNLFEVGISKLKNFFYKPISLRIKNRNLSDLDNSSPEEKLRNLRKKFYRFGVITLSLELLSELIYKPREITAAVYKVMENGMLQYQGNVKLLEISPLNIVADVLLLSFIPYTGYYLWKRRKLLKEIEQ
jgi:hypothetical protein